MLTKLVNILLLNLVLTMGVASCGTVVGNPEEGDDDPVGPPPAMLADLPDLRGLNLTSLGTGASSGLMAQQDCSGTGGLGAFSLVYAPACILTVLTSQTMYGPNPDKNDDDRLTCDEFDPDNENGILFPLLCDDNITALGEVSSLRVEENGGELAIGFGKNNDYGKGTWNARGEDSERYPAAIRVWVAEAGKDLEGAIAMMLDSGSKGTVFYDVKNEDWIVGDSRFDVKAEKNMPECDKTPGEETCHFQEFQFVGEPDNVDHYSSLRMVMYANDRKKADVLMIEGKYTYTAEQAKKQLTGDPNFAESFAKIREIYFRTVQKGGQIWGSMDFKDEKGQTIVTSLDFPGGSIDVTDVLRNGNDGVAYAGVCVNFGSDDWVECKDVNYKEYDSLWKGDSAFDVDLPYEQPIDYEDLPPKGLCRPDGDGTSCMI